MGTGRYDIAKRLSALSDEMRRALQDFMSSKNPASILHDLSGWKPPTDVFETEDSIVVRMDIAGMASENILVGFDGSRNILTIAGRRVDQSSQRKTGYHQMEIIYGTFQRQIYVPAPVDVNSIRSTYRNGFLEITFRKAKRPVTRVISIKISL